MLKELEVEKIVSGKNVRNEHDEEIIELMQSIEKQGLLNPILVQKNDCGKYEVIAGHRRFEAVKRLRLPFIECNIVEDMSDRDILAAQIAENVQRKDMSAFELVDTFEEMKKRFNLNSRQLAKMFGKSESWVCNQYQAVRIIDHQYGETSIPAEVKSKTAGQIKNDLKKAMNGNYELIICKGMKVKVVGHTYTVFCGDNNAENALRKFIEARKIGKK